MLKVVEYYPNTLYTLNMKRGSRYVGLINGKRHWTALVCGHPVPMYQTKRCWSCWKLEMSAARTGIKKKIVHKGKAHHSWKGGKVICGGYVLIKKHDHPYARQNNYVAEHRLVMEEKLGRYLLPEEEVHHRNHDKLDNRPENLMLFSSHSEHIKYEHKEGKRK